MGNSTSKSNPSEGHWSLMVTLYTSLSVKRARHGVLLTDVVHTVNDGELVVAANVVRGRVDSLPDYAIPPHPARTFSTIK